MTIFQSKRSSIKTVQLIGEYAAMFADPDEPAPEISVQRGSLDFPPYWWVVPLEQGSQHTRDPFARYFVPSPLLRVREYFEPGAVVDAVRSMRQQHLVARPVFINHKEKSRTVYFVGPPETLETNIERFRRWFAADTRESAIPTYFDELFLRGKKPAFWEPIPDIRAWLSVGDEVAWTLSEDEADLLLCAFRV